MIALIEGVIKEINNNSLIIGVNGIGYEVAVGPELLGRAQLDEVISLHTYLAIKDNAHELYGFMTKNQLEFFKKLLTISGVGPKSALHIISLGSVRDLCGAIARGDTKYLTGVAGIGRKTAERIVVELKSKVAEFVGAAIDGQEESTDEITEIIEALEQLGYSGGQAREAAVYACKQEEGPVEEKMRCAFIYLSN